MDFSKFSSSNTIVVLTSNALKFVDWSPLSAIQTLPISPTSISLYTPTDTDLIYILENQNTLSLYSRSLSSIMLSYPLAAGNSPYTAACASNTGEFIVVGASNGH